MNASVLPIEPPHVMTPEQWKAFTAAYYTGMATLAMQESKQQPKGQP